MNLITGGIVDTEYNTAHGLAPYMMYTCKDSGGDNVRIWLWETYEPNSKVPALAFTPKLNIKVPQISSIKFNTKLEDAVANAAAEAVKKIDFSKIDIKLNID